MNEELKSQKSAKNWRGASGLMRYTQTLIICIGKIFGWVSLNLVLNMESVKQVDVENLVSFYISIPHYILF